MTLSKLSPTFAFQQVLSCLAEEHEVHPDKLSALAGRLKHYQKRGFPAGINTGRGKAASYSIGHVLKLAIALELNELGLAPERVIAMIGRFEQIVATTVSVALIDDAANVMLYCDPGGLHDLRSESDFSRTVLFAVDDRSIHRFIDTWLDGELDRVAFINITGVLNSISVRLERISEYSEADLRLAMLDWAKSSARRSDGDDPQA